MKDLLRCCAADTGCDEITVKTIAASLLESIAKRLSAGRDVDLRDELGLYIANKTRITCQRIPRSHSVNTNIQLRFINATHQNIL